MNKIAETLGVIHNIKDVLWYYIKEIPERLNPDMFIASCNGLWPIYKYEGVFPLYHNRQNIGIFRPDSRIKCKFKIDDKDDEEDPTTYWEVDPNTVPEGVKLWDYEKDYAYDDAADETIPPPDHTGEVKYGIIEFYNYDEYCDYDPWERYMFNKIKDKLMSKYQFHSYINPLTNKVHYYLFVTEVPLGTNEDGNTIDYYCKARWFDSMVNLLYTDMETHLFLTDIKEVIEFFRKHRIKWPFCSIEKQNEIDKCLARIMSVMKHGDIFWLY